MRPFIVVAAMTLASQLASAQTQPTRSSAWATLPTLPAAFPTSALSPCYSSLNATSPCYSGTAFPYYSAIPAEISSNPDHREIFKTTHLDEYDVKRRMRAKGYDEVAELRKDDRGIWRGKTTLADGRAAAVILDLDGNIYSQPIDGSR
jgi:hypothetical protein